MKHDEDWVIKAENVSYTYDGNDKKNKEEIRAQVADNSSDETLSIVLVRSRRML